MMTGIECSRGFCTLVLHYCELYQGTCFVHVFNSKGEMSTVMLLCNSFFSIGVFCLIREREEMISDDESDEEMEVEGPVPPTTPTTPRALVKPPKHDLMMTEEVTL